MSSQLQRLIITAQQKRENRIVLTAEQQHYLYRVLRLGQGDRFIAMDGQGKAWIAVLEQEEAMLSETLPLNNELAANLTLMAALPKGNGFDEIVRCCTELGVNTFVPIISDRVLLRPSPQKLTRWCRIATEAAEQSERAIVPTILDPQPFGASLQTVQATTKYICVARGSHPALLSCLQNGEGREIALLTGPEGGWTTKEVAEAQTRGYQPVSLGQGILRAITAAIASVALVAACTRGVNIRDEREEQSPLSSPRDSTQNPIH